MLDLKAIVVTEKNAVAITYSIKYEKSAERV